MASTVAVADAPRVRTFVGHPLGLGFLVFAEAWERFSYYGMQSLLVLYMVQQLLLPGHVDHIGGFGAFRAVIEHIFGPRNSPVALASAIFGFYSGGVYLTPLAGGFIADRILGRTKTIIVGALLMSLGHFLMAFDQSFVLALLCLLVGVGCFKGNIASQVGELYAPGDLRRADAFQVFFLGINIAVIVAPLVCGTLGEEVAWHWGFGAAGVGMVLGLVVYLSGRRWLPPDPRIERKAGRSERPKLVPGEFATICVLVLLLIPLAVASLGNQQIFDAYLVWGKANYNLTLSALIPALRGLTHAPGFIRTMAEWLIGAINHPLPVSWLISLDAIVSTVTIAGSVMFWRWWATFAKEPDEIVKLAIGAFISACAPLILAAASAKEAITHEKVGLAWGLGFHIVNDIGFANVFPVGLALYSRASPKAVAGVMIGVYYLNLFMANMGVGWLGGRLGTMPDSAFWLLHAGLVAGGGAAILACAFLFHRQLAPTVDPEAAQA